jgi:Protein of unknown function (DUF616)
VVTIITAIYGGYDDLKPVLEQDVPVRWVCITDRARDSNGWEIIVHPRPDLRPRLASKIPKCVPWEFMSEDQSIWIDASFRVVSSVFAREALALANPIAQYSHNVRRCIYTEAAVSHGLIKYANEPVFQQIAHYQKQGHPPNWGLWATGVIARQHNPRTKAMGEAWLAQILRWTTQDQISEPTCLLQADLRPSTLPGSFASGWLRYEASALHDNNVPSLPWDHQ